MTAARTPEEMRAHVQADGVVASGFVAFLGIEVVRCWDGECELSLEVRPDLTQSFRTLHGGIYAALVDIVSGFAAYSRFGPVLTADIATQMLAPAAVGRTVRAVASVASERAHHVIVTSRLHIEGDVIATAVTKLVAIARRP